MISWVVEKTEVDTFNDFYFQIVWRYPYLILHVDQYLVRFNSAHFIGAGLWGELLLDLVVVMLA